MRSTALAADSARHAATENQNPASALSIEMTVRDASAGHKNAKKTGVNLMLMRGGRLKGRYPHLEGGAVKRMRIADEKEANARKAELTAMVKEWCALQTGGSSDRWSQPRQITISTCGRTEAGALLAFQTIALRTGYLGGDLLLPGSPRVWAGDTEQWSVRSRLTKGELVTAGLVAALHNYFAYSGRPVGR